MVKEAILLNGISELAITKLDVLDGSVAGAGSACAPQALKSRLDIKKREKIAFFIIFLQDNATASF